MQRKSLVRGVKALSSLLVLAVLFVLFDSLIDFRPSAIDSSYHFKLSDLPVDEPVYLHQDNLSIVVIRRSDQTNQYLQRPDQGLQDANSSNSRQPEFARNKLRSSNPGYYVSYAMGTDLGCPLRTIEKQLQETCSKARYDFAGRALQGGSQYQNLRIPDYSFSNEFQTLTIKP
jgi:hypothetical protein